MPRERHPHIDGHNTERMLHSGIVGGAIRPTRLSLPVRKVILLSLVRYTGRYQHFGSEKIQAAVLMHVQL